jgi:predicted esterase
MKLLMHSSICLLLLSFSYAQEIKSIPRKIPPQGISLSEKSLKQIKSELNKLETQLNKIEHPLKADVEIYFKAVSFAVKNGEFYNKKDAAKALALIKTGLARCKNLKAGSAPWKNSKGVFCRGFISKIDGSAQPYGIEIPKNLDLNKKVPVWIWLHGRGDKTTDLHFMAQRDNAKYKFPKEKAIILQPFGRQCIGYKSAGETDIMEMIEHVKSQYKIDENRIALLGFSMGGAGAWHLGAHYARKWAVVHAGAGFAETAKYIKLKKEDYPAWYEQKLWGTYDVPDYTRNLFNIPVIAYSGENDKQIQAARIMEVAYKSHGKTLKHIIGPKMGHKYAPGYLDKVCDFVRNAVDKGRNIYPTKVHLQTKTLRYNKMYWVEITGLAEHWMDSRVDAELINNSLLITTKNVSSLTISAPWKGKEFPSGFVISINNQKMTLPKSCKVINLSHINKWLFTEQTSPMSRLNKTSSLQGPLDDAFLSPFLVVKPSKKSKNAKLQRWLDFEITHLEKRWRELFRGTIRIKYDKDVTEEDIRKYNLILWGNPLCNSIIGKYRDQLPIKWSKESVIVNDKSYPAATHIPQFIFPLGSKYLVINSGPTFREGHDRTNSLQNPKLPDWAIIDITQDPNALTPGKIIDANFFDEHWKFKAK